MRRATRRTNTKSNLFTSITSRLFTNSKILSHVISFSTLGILFVLIRMKGVEQDYKFNDLTKKIQMATIEDKELRAEKANLLSINNLRRFAIKFNLKEPDEKHIVIVP